MKDQPATKDPLSGCEGKVPFAHKNLAAKAAKRSKGRMPYLCAYCRQWHVGGTKFVKPKAER